MIKYIVTHPGKAHLDDFLAACICISKYDCPVYRRNPHQDELKSSKVIVLDIGGDYNPALMNFDHHQFQYENNDFKPECTISLILKHLGIYELAESYWGWLFAAECLDVKGPFKLAEELKINSDVILALSSPVEKVMLHIFEEQDEISIYNGKEYIHGIFKEIGTRLLNSIAQWNDASIFFEKHVEERNIYAKDGATHSKYLFLNRMTECPFKVEEFIWKYVDKFDSKDFPVVVFKAERTQEGYKIIRRNDDPRFDFRLFPKDENIAFCHSNGFIIATKNNSQSYIQEIIEKSVK